MTPEQLGEVIRNNKYLKMDTTTKKVITETLGGSREVPALSKANTALFRAAAEVQLAYQYWKLVDRDNDKLNAKLNKVRLDYKENEQ